MNHFRPDEEAIVAYTAKGEPLTKKDLKNSLDQASKDIREGRGYSPSQVRELVKSWRKK